MGVAIDMHGKVVLITGGAKGVGKGITEVFSAAGATVEICGRTTPSPTDGVGFTTIDVRDDEQVQGWVQAMAERHGRIDVLVNNVGGSPASDFGTASPRFGRKILDLNFTSAMVATQAVYAPMQAQAEGGAVINITSVSARRPSPGTAVYGAAKAALENLTQTLGVEWAPKIRVNAVSSGLVLTDGARDYYGEGRDADNIAATIARGQFASPADIGNVCLFLASPLAAHLYGAVVPVDGGGEWPVFLYHSPIPDGVPAPPQPWKDPQP